MRGERRRIRGGAPVDSSSPNLADEELLLLEMVQKRRVEDEEEEEEETKETAVSQQSPPSPHKQDTKVQLLTWLSLSPVPPPPRLTSAMPVVFRLCPFLSA